jgi:hypothetical protein
MLLLRGADWNYQCGVYCGPTLYLVHVLQTQQRCNLTTTLSTCPQAPFLVWTETPSGGTPNFLTGAGGFLQTAYFG